MKEAALQFFEQYPNIALISAFSFAVFVALVGIIPSFFVTAAAVLFFGFWPGIGITFAGETIGAAIAFFLYRKGFKQSIRHKLEKYKAAENLLNADERKAFWIIFSLRLIPVLPSGIVTFASAMSRASLLTFAVAGSMGKLPSLLLEGYTALQVKELSWQGKVIVSVTGLVFLYLLIRKIASGRSKKS